MDPDYIHATAAQLGIKDPVLHLTHQTHNDNETRQHHLCS